MLILSRTADGTRIDLAAFLLRVSSDLAGLESFTTKFLDLNPYWKQLADEASRKYSTDLKAMMPNQASHRTARKIQRTDREVLLANKLSLFVLFGYSHYLKWAGFEIHDPVNVEEVTRKLGYSREVMVRIGFTLAQRIGFKEEKATRCFAESFSVGAALGFLTLEAHLNGTERAIYMLSKPST